MAASSPFTATSLDVDPAPDALRLTARVSAVDGQPVRGWAAFVAGGRMLHLAPLDAEGTATMDARGLPSRLLQARFVPALTDRHFPSESEAVLHAATARREPVAA
jgi:hypothetical protein